MICGKYRRFDKKKNSIEFIASSNARIFDRYAKQPLPSVIKMHFLEWLKLNTPHNPQINHFGIFK